MRRLTLVLGACLLAGLVAPPARAASTGVIKGRVVNRTTNAPQAGARVVLVGSGGGEATERAQTTGPDGRYEFVGLPTGDDHIYALDTHYSGGLFPGSPLTIPDDTDERPIITSTVNVWATTTEPAAVVIQRDNLFALPSDGGLGVVEAVTVLNSTDRAYIGRRGGQQTLGFALPAGADQQGVSIVESTIDIPELVRTDFGFATTVAIPPGTTRITYSYRVEGVVGSYDLSRTALYPIVDYAIYAAPPLRLEGSLLEEDGEVTIGDDTYRKWSTRGAVDTGDPLQAAVVAEAGTGPLATAGIAAAIVAVVVAGGLLARRARRRGEPSPERPPNDATARDDILVAIAELDLQRSSGAITEDEWRSRRGRLKRKLEEPEPAR